MAAIEGARRIVNFIESLSDFHLLNEIQNSYNHVGATLSDAGLQAGINYRTVVAPRVNHLLTKWPKARTTSGFLVEIQTWGLNKMLSWTHPDKPRRIYEMALLLADHKVETEAELADWLENDTNRKILQKVRGVGPKTIDYLRKLVGLPAIAIDRHLRRFASWAGVPYSDYNEMEKIYRFTADLLGVDCGSLDRMIWTYMASSSKGFK